MILVEVIEQSMVRQFSFKHPNLPVIMESYTNSETTSWEPDFDSEADRFETDRNLERKVINALRSNELIHFNDIKVRVTGRLVFLEGKVRFRKERMLAQRCVMDLFGIRAIINYLTYPSVFCQ